MIKVQFQDFSISEILTWLTTLDLFQATLAWRFVRAPAQQTGAMAESSAREMIIADFDDEFGLKRLPFEGTFCAPAARGSWCATREAGRHNERFERAKQSLA